MAIPAALLVGLWGYTASGLLAGELQVHDDSSLATSVSGPVYHVLAELQVERRLTATWQADRSASSRAALEKARSNTDAALASYRRSSGAAPKGRDLKDRVKDVNTATVKLSENRSAIDRRTLDESGAFAFYSDTVADIAGVIDSAARSGDDALARAGSATSSLVQFAEMLSREDALLSGALASGEISTASRTQFAQYVAIQRQIRTALLNTDDLPGNQAAAYERVVSDPQWKSLASIEDRITAEGGQVELPEEAGQWRTAADTVDRGLHDVTTDSFTTMAGEGSDRSDELLLQFILGTLAVLAALVVTGVLLRRAAGSASHRMTRLREQIQDLGDRRLPEVLMQLDLGEHIEPTGATPVAPPDADDLERLSVAVKRLGREFESALARQARGREGTEKVFANLTRRTQILVHRLISLLDDLERKHEDSDLLQDIFKVDHLATRVRRHSENLVILGGSAPGRRGIRPLSITDVVRGAVSETEQYRRVTVQSLPPGTQLVVAARAVTDITHLLAELIENGTTFSPPDTQVQISARNVAKGLALHVEDRGLGMPAEQYEHLNALLAKPPQPDMDALGKDPRLGLFVVAKLAERHGLKVSLRESDYGGTLAVVLVPASLLQEQESALPKELTGLTGFSGSAASARFPGPPVAESDPAALPGAAHAHESPTDPGTATAPAAAGVPEFVSAHATSTPLHVNTHGFPDYGGEGLLPPLSDGQDSGRPAVWSPPASERALSVPSDPLSGYSDPYPAVSAYEGTYPPPAGDPLASSAGLLPQHASQSAADPQALPTRTRGASLARQLREEAAVPSRPGRRDVEQDTGTFTPGRSAANMTAIQRETRRAREGQVPRTAELEGPAESRQHGNDEL